MTNLKDLIKKHWEKSLKYYLLGIIVIPLTAATVFGIVNQILPADYSHFDGKGSMINTERTIQHPFVCKEIMGGMGDMYSYEYYCNLIDLLTKSEVYGLGVIFRLFEFLKIYLLSSIVLIPLFIFILSKKEK
jgi:hypothetical protein